MHLFEPEMFAPGTVMWDHTDLLDPAVPVSEQDGLISEDVVAIRFASGAILDVGYVGPRNEKRFVVSVAPPGDEYEPLVERDCHSIPALVEAVTELLPLARDWRAA